MGKQAILAMLLLLLAFVSGCNTGTTGEATKDVCDDLCQQERAGYVKEVNTFLTQAQEITAKIGAWKTVTKEDLELITSLKNQVFALNIPEGFDLAQDYYQRVFNHYVEAIDYVVKANEEYASDTLNVQSRDIAMSKVVYNLQEANKILIYADEETKFAARLVAKT